MREPTSHARSVWNPNLMRTLRLPGEANQCASDTLADSRVQKPKKFPCIFLASPPPTPPPRNGKRNGKEIFWFCFAVSVSEKSISILSLLICSFLCLHGDRGAPPSSVVTRYSANHAQVPTHSPLAFARAGCFGIVRVRSVASLE